ncbi:hypothetical protein [Rhodococcus wratislaviensis]|uniref:Uncharacterized protein n=1 Tax=Rhodococcus wratislaviensis NBRC 100605 TaxID=1219028 RepID=X0PTQ7_RHOWR|nr:hypothetical protein [Rhodococcus wratislaviensis]GAF46469.1 hypothetical protein RW1_031_00530 [Rhodococcus wratislaviensis NBRC 100605]
MNKKVYAAVASVTAAIAAVGLINAGTATAAIPLGPTTNQCAHAPNSAEAPVARADGIFIKDPAALLVTSVNVRSLGTGSLSGDIAGKVIPGSGILVPTQGIGIGTLSGLYIRQVGLARENCTVNGTFMLT